MKSGFDFKSYLIRVSGVFLAIPLVVIIRVILTLNHIIFTDNVITGGTFVIILASMFYTSSLANKRERRLRGEHKTDLKK